MDTKGKLALLEVIVRIFAGVWIIASIAILYFLVRAVFFDDLGVGPFWTLGLGAAAK